MLDLQIISPDEPVEPDYVITFTDLSDSDKLFQGCFAHWAKNVENHLGVKVTSKSVSYKDGIDRNDPSQRRYVGDFYVVAQESKESYSMPTMRDSQFLQESVQNWRFHRADTVFHLTRVSYKNDTVWLHFILTNQVKEFAKP